MKNSKCTETCYAVIGFTGIRWLINEADVTLDISSAEPVFLYHDTRRDRAKIDYEALESNNYVGENYTGKPQFVGRIISGTTTDLMVAFDVMQLDITDFVAEILGLFSIKGQLLTEDQLHNLHSELLLDWWNEPYQRDIDRFTDEQLNQSNVCDELPW